MKEHVTYLVGQIKSDLKFCTWVVDDPSFSAEENLVECVEVLEYVQSLLGAAIKLNRRSRTLARSRKRGGK